MEGPVIEDERITDPLLERHGDDGGDGDTTTKGGLRTMSFIIANESFEQVASYGLLPNMVLYLTREYHLEMATASNLLFLWSALTNFMPLLGAVVADSLLGRFRTILFGCFFSLAGMALLWLIAVIPELRPPPCIESNYLCSSATSLQLLFLCTSFGLMSIGAGGVRSSSLAFGADQLRRGGTGILGRYFSWYYATATLSVLVAFTCIVYVQENLGMESWFWDSLCAHVLLDSVILPGFFLLCEVEV